MQITLWGTLISLLLMKHIQQIIQPCEEQVCCIRPAGGGEGDTLTRHSTGVAVTKLMFIIYLYILSIHISY